MTTAGQSAYEYVKKRSGLGAPLQMIQSVLQCSVVLGMNQIRHQTTHQVHQIQSLSPKSLLVHFVTIMKWIILLAALPLHVTARPGKKGGGWWEGTCDTSHNLCYINHRKRNHAVKDEWGYKCDSAKPSAAQWLDTMYQCVYSYN
ncbi:hypothetical protein O9K51_06487 [Purpureocillium lavendulum]|uniref:Uncharacterized protein n=1 Tax=Purpureocillium lavendulum TaxID=1247861 RepID=A0AB34FNE0_9HYPO|nr:hypothetical protein O9K51_06487 [Purpureocillium lavendulum]